MKFLFTLTLLSIFAVQVEGSDFDGTCRGKSKKYGNIAFSFRDGFSATSVIRNCGLIDDLAKALGKEPANYDTYVITTFAEKFKQIEEKGMTIGLACSFTPKLGESSLNDPISKKQLEAPFKQALVEMRDAKDGIILNLKVVGEKGNFSASLPLTEVKCDSGFTIGENEGLCP